MKLFFAGLLHETNNLSPIPTTLDTFRETMLWRPSTGEDPVQRDRFLEMVPVPAIGARRGHEVTTSVLGFAMPSLPLRRDHWEILCGEIIGDLTAHGPFDAVFLFLHGAQMVQGADDAQADILARVRAVVGPDVPIAVELDLHANLTAEVIALADFVAACKEYPHTDWPEVAEQLVVLLERRLAGEIRPVTAFQRVPMLQLYPTTVEPMKSLVRRVRALERTPGVLTITLAQGFPITDWEHTGASVLVTTDADPGLAETLCQQLATEFFDQRHGVADESMPMDEAIDRALAAPKGPFVVSDNSDSQGGAAPWDSTFFLRRLLERGVQGAAVGMFWDPQAVRFCREAGVGSVIPLRVGGKVGMMSGVPLDLMAEVTCVRDDAVQHGLGAVYELGPAAAIRVAGIDVVLCSLRQQVFSPECFTELGIDLASKKLIVVKSAQHFRALFEPIVEGVMFSGRFETRLDRYEATPMPRVPRPIWPLEEPPFEQFGRSWS